MKGVPTELDGAAVVLFTRIDERHRPTGNCRHFVKGVLARPAAGLAICRYEGQDSFYLFGCDADWNVVTDTFHDTLEEAKAQAEFEYEGAGATWQSSS